MSEIVVEIRDEAWTGWSSLAVAHSLGAGAGTVQLTGASIPARGLTGASIPARGLTGLEPIRILVDGTAVFTGHLDEVEINVSGEDSSFSTSGRSLTGDLIDSQIDPFAGFSELHNVDVVEVATRYARGGLAIPLIFDVERDLPRLKTFAPTPGETYFEAIERACRFSGVLATATGDGELLILSPTRFPRGSVNLREGENVIAMRASTSWRERFRSIVVEGEGSGDSDGWKEELRVLETAEDESVRPLRIGVVTLEGDATAEIAKKRAQWEVAVRAARGSKVSVVVEGWRQGGDGDPWRPGIRVSMALPSVGVSGTLVLDSVTLSYGDSGELAALSFSRSDAYQSAPKLKVEDDPTAGLLGADE